jgi:hypothetical protein
VITVDALDEHGDTQLMIAAVKGDLDKVKDLLEAGANPHIKDKDGMTARVRAANRFNADVADLLEMAEKSFQPQTDGGPSGLNEGNDLAQEKPLSNSPETEGNEVSYIKDEQTVHVTPGLTVIFYILAVLSFIGGIILANEFRPGDPGHGYVLKPEAYMLSIIWFTVGVIEAALFAAIGQGLSYLHRIVENTSK